MIRINKPPDPPRRQGKKRKAKKTFRYNEDFIVAELWSLQHKKCCYCEGDIPATGHAKAVEHFRPKSVFKSLTNDWDNLLLACSQCNGKKSDKFPMELTSKRNEAKVIFIKLDSKKRSLLKKGGISMLIDPTKENPEEYLDFILDMREELFGLIVAKDGKERGAITIDVIGLNSDFYRKRHRDFLIDSLMPRYMTLTKAKYAGEENIIRSCKIEFEQWMADSCKIAGFTRAFARYYKLDRYGISIPGDN